MVFFGVMGLSNPALPLRPGNRPAGFGMRRSGFDAPILPIYSPAGRPSVFKRLARP